MSSNSSDGIDERPRNNNKKIETHVVCGTIGTKVFESIFYEGNPAFLTFDNGKFDMASFIVMEDKILLPLTAEMCPYRPYSITATELERVNKAPNFSPHRLYQKIRDVISSFCDIEEQYKELEATYCFLTYIQHKLSSVSYLFHYGEPGSGKSRTMELHNYLSYRPLLSVKLPPADVYSYLGDKEEGVGTILEDEAKDLHEDSEKMKLYRIGYRPGNKVARIEFSATGKRRLRYFNTFGCKIFASYCIPNDEAFVQRCIPIHTIQGKPMKDEIEKVDLAKFDQLRNALLFWRMATYFQPLPRVELQLNGRIKELWKPLIQLGQLLPSGKIMEALANNAVNKIKEALEGSFEAHITRAVVSLCVDFHGKEVLFEALWGAFIEEVEPKHTWENKIDTDLFGEVSKARFARSLNTVLGVENKVRNMGGKKRAKYYIFDIKKLIKAAEKYGLPDDQVTKLRALLP